MKFKVFSCIVGFFLTFSALQAEEGAVVDYRVVVIGSGVGGLTSSLYLARANAHILVIEGSADGGAIMQSENVENWPGEMKISGGELIQKIRSQVQSYQNVEFLSSDVIGVDFSKKPYIIETENLLTNCKSKIRAESVIIASGSRPNYLNIAGEKRFWGAGISNCALCDGNLYADKTVAVIGGGDSAIVEADYLSNIAQKVYVIVRKNELRAKDKAKADSLKVRNNVQFMFNTEAVEFSGEGALESMLLKNSRTDKTEKLKVDGVFLAIGSTPNTEMFKGQLKLDEKGFVVVDDQQRTNVRDVYAVGDVTDINYKQAITASADGAKAAISLQGQINFTQKNSSEKEAGYLQIDNNPIEVVSEEQFDRYFNDAKMPILVDFYATWCGPCKRLAPVLEEKGASLKGRILILKVNVDKIANLANRYNVKSMPTVILFKNRQLAERRSGLYSIIKLLDELEKQ